MSEYDIVSIIISMTALCISTLQFIFYRKDEIIHRKNDIKPILKCESVHCFSEGNVPNARWSMGVENGICIPIYLVITNIGFGHAINPIIKISIESELSHRVLVPSVIKSDETTRLLIQLEDADQDFLIDKFIRVDIKYSDLDGNLYTTKLAGIFLSYGEELIYKVTEEYMDNSISIDGCDELAKYTDSEW